MEQAGTNTVGTLGLSVRCRTILTMYPLTGTDALRLDTTGRPYARATHKICGIKTLRKSCLVISFFIFAVEEVILIKEQLRSYSELPCLFT